MFADSRQIVDDGNADSSQQLARANAGALQQGRRIDRTRRKDHFAPCAGRCRLHGVRDILDADRLATLENKLALATAPVTTCEIVARRMPG